MVQKQTLVRKTCDCFLGRVIHIICWDQRHSTISENSFGLFHICTFILKRRTVSENCPIPYIWHLTCQNVNLQSATQPGRRRHNNLKWRENCAFVKRQKKYDQSKCDSLPANLWEGSVAPPTNSEGEKTCQSEYDFQSADQTARSMAP